jgi:biopolymer transport protein ExbD
VAKSDLSRELHNIFDLRPTKVIFVKGDTTVTYQEVLSAIDVARGSGVKVIGIPPKDTPGSKG